MNKRTLLFAAAVVLQVLILLGVPAQKFYTRATGRTVVLKVAPVDPYNLLSGYYVTLGYDISQPTAFPNAPQFESGATVYAIVEQQADGLWRPAALVRERPAQLPANRVALRGRYDGWRLSYGIEEFYIPETQRQAVDEDLRKNPEQARVEVKVDARGKAALTRLLIQERVYE